MTLEKVLEQRGYLTAGRKKCRCPNPNHLDTNPSAMVNVNSVYCFGCARLYNLRQISQWLGTNIDEVPGDQFQRKSGEPLFTE